MAQQDAHTTVKRQAEMGPKNSPDTSRCKGQPVKTKMKPVKAIKAVEDCNKVPVGFSNAVDNVVRQESWEKVTGQLVTAVQHYSPNIGLGRLSPGLQSLSTDTDSDYSPNALSPEPPSPVRRSPDRQSPVRRSPEPRGRISSGRLTLHKLVQPTDTDMNKVADHFMAVMRAKFALLRSVGKKPELIPLPGTPLKTKAMEALSNPEVFGVLSAIKSNQHRRDNTELQAEFEEVMRRIRQALENVEMVEDTPSLTLPEIADRLHKKIEERDSLMKTFKQFGSDIESRIEILMDLQEWFKYHHDLGKDVLSYNQMEAVIEKTEKMHEVLSSSLDMFIVGGRALSDSSEPLLLATNKVLGNTAKDKERTTYYAKALAESAVKWHLAVTEVKDVCEILVGRTRNGPLWKSMVFALEQFNELIAACDMTYNLLKEKKKLCADNQTKLKTLLKEVETSTRDVDLLRKRASRITEDLIEIRRQMESLENKKLDLTSKIQELTTKLSGLETTIQKLGISMEEDTTDDDIPSDATEEEILNIYRMEMVQKRLKNAKDDIKQAQDSLQSMKNDLKSKQKMNKKLQRLVAKERKAMKKISGQESTARSQEKGGVDLMTAVHVEVDIEAGQTVPEEKLQTGTQGETVTIKTKATDWPDPLADNEMETKMEGLMHMAGADQLRMFDSDVSVDAAVDDNIDTYPEESVASTRTSSQAGCLNEDDLFKIQQEIVQMLHSVRRFRGKVLLCIPPDSAPKPDPAEIGAPHPDKALIHVEGLTNDELLFEPREVLEAVFAAVKKYMQKMESIFPEKMEETLAMKKRRRSILFRQKLERRLTQASLEVNVVPELFPGSREKTPRPQQPESKQQLQHHIHVPASHLKNNIQLLKDALKRKQITTKEHKTAMITIKERLEIPGSRLESLLEMYVRYMTASKTRVMLTVVLRDDLHPNVRAAIDRQCTELQDNVTQYMNVWKGVMSQSQHKCEQLDQYLYQMFLKMRLQSGVLLFHPLLQATNQDDLLNQASGHLTRAQMQDLLCTGATSLKAMTLQSSSKLTGHSVATPPIGSGFFPQNVGPIRNVNASNTNRRSAIEFIPRLCPVHKHHSTHSRNTSHQVVESTHCRNTSHQVVESTHCRNTSHQMVASSIPPQNNRNGCWGTDPDGLCVWIPILLCQSGGLGFEFENETGIPSAMYSGWCVFLVDIKQTKAGMFSLKMRRADQREESVSRGYGRINRQ